MEGRDDRYVYLFAGLAVRDFAVAYRWYERLFDRPADMFPHDHEAVWRLASTGAVYVVGDAERAGSGLVTVAVNDLEAHTKRLRAEGLVLIEESEGAAPLRLTVTDDDGNKMSFFQDPSGNVSAVD